MTHRSLLAVVLGVLIVGLTLSNDAQVYADEPAMQQLPFDDLPEEIKKKILEKIKEYTNGEEADSENGETEEKDGEEETEKKEGDGEEKDKKDAEKKAKSPDAVMNEAVKKLKAEIAQMDTEFQYKVAKYKQELEEQRLKIEKMKLDQQIEDQLKSRETTELKKTVARLKLETDLTVTQNKLKKAKLDQELAEMAAKKSAIDARLAGKTSDDRLKNIVLDDIDYPEEPFQKGVLHISDRRIELNGPIFSGAAKYVTDRIHYFNNQSDEPIFLVIDSSPGGSVMEGFQIVQAMKNSKAKIHVVVKRFAASMAAIITTLADHSYTYPNAIILHHQASSIMYGNTTEQKEQLDRMNEVSSRLLGAVAKKIGISEEQFVREMYENRSTGDWDLYGDQATKKNWVEHVVSEIREENIRNRPKKSTTVVKLLSGLHKAPTGDYDRYEVQLVEETDDKGKRFVRLPYLSPIDMWYMYNPNGYYR